MNFNIHPVMIRALIQCLHHVFDEGFYSDKVLERAFKQNRKWGSHDRRFIAETFYDMVRWWGFLVTVDEGPFSSPNDVIYLTRWAFYEMWKNQRDVFPFVQTNFPEMKIPVKDGEQASQHIKNMKLEPWEKLSFPQWLYEKFQEDFQGETTTLLTALNNTAPVVLRVNTLKSDRQTVAELLKREGVETILAPTASDGLVLKERKNVFATQAFKEGLFEVQEEASQKVAALLDPRPGERVADVCAGAGGKTLHLAALMKNKGSIWACDTSEKKLRQLQLRARRAGVCNLRIQLFEGSKTVKRQAGKFDRVLVDVPCTGSGVIRRNCDTKWKINALELDRVLKLQSEILEGYAKLVAPGGHLVYATCSLFRDENEKQVEDFLSKHGEFEKEGLPLKTRPDLTNEDGFFAQKMVRKS